MQMLGQTSSLSDCQGPATSMCFAYPDKDTIFPFALQAWSELQNSVRSQLLTSCDLGQAHVVISTNVLRGAEARKSLNRVLGI